MADKAPQTYATHTSVTPAYHYYMFAVVVVYLVWTLYRFIGALLGDVGFSFDLLMNVLVAGVLIVIFAYMRIWPLTVQDRVVRLELKLRLNEILPDDLKGRIGELSKGQMMAIRFAGDEELPDLMREVLDEGITDRGEIKKKVKDWQPDHWRC